MAPNPNDLEMSAPQGATYLRRIRLATDQRELAALAREVVERFPGDEATPRLVGVIAVKIDRLTRAN